MFIKRCIDKGNVMYMNNIFFIIVKRSEIIYCKRKWMELKILIIVVFIYNIMNNVFFFIFEL